MAEKFFAPETGEGFVLEGRILYDIETGEVAAPDLDLLLEDEDGTETTVGDELELAANLAPDPDEIAAAAHDTLIDQREAARAQHDAAQAYLEQQFDAEVDGLIDQYEAEEEAAEEEEAEAEAEEALRHDFRVERDEWEKTRGFDLTQAEAAGLWGEYQRARIDNPSTSFAEVVERDADRQAAYVPNTSRDRRARRERLAAHMEEAEQEAELDEAMEASEAQEEPASSDPRDEKARRAELAAAMEGGDE